MEWHGIKPHHGQSYTSSTILCLHEHISRSIFSNGDLRKLSFYLRIQPLNFMIVFDQSLMTAKNGKELCNIGLKNTKILLGEEGNSEHHTAKKIENLRKSATNLSECVNGIHNKFRLLGSIVLDVRIRSFSTSFHFIVVCDR